MTTAMTCVTPARTAAAGERRSRRRALLSAASAVVAGLATVLKASPAVADCLGSPCCSLASCEQCQYAVSRDRYTCPDGYRRTVWTCVSGSRTYGCGECSTGETCNDGPFACSIWYAW
ncbi:hypothetical protein [Couchioplanes azureus]|uniref:hypothetical protein n=1 Tax=Couchioplanes caeruleus TaxID=56438 RepID=UPI00166F82B1|nr:hypothetical protein [Couchioplanes caeruleus]GGQ60212.1 hypothetical protein GCM10010166_32280 [Couchioplanes caeruleus subsp. azureus]